MSLQRARHGKLVQIPVRRWVGAARRGSSRHGQPHELIPLAIRAGLVMPKEFAIAARLGGAFEAQRLMSRGGPDATGGARLGARRRQDERLVRWQYEGQPC